MTNKKLRKGLGHTTSCGWLSMAGADVCFHRAPLRNILDSALLLRQQKTQITCSDFLLSVFYLPPPRHFLLSVLPCPSLSFFRSLAPLSVYNRPAFKPVILTSSPATFLHTSTENESNTIFNNEHNTQRERRITLIFQLTFN